MSLIKSISGIRGTIGGRIGDNLTPPDLVACTSGYGQWILNQNRGNVVIVGRDGRMSGELVSKMVISTLRFLGINVIDAGLTTTPTVEIAVKLEGAAGGIILTASHNPKHWNALKLLNAEGEFLSANAGQTVLELASNEISYASVEHLGNYTLKNYTKAHLELIMEHPLVNARAVQDKGFTVVVDCINSTGALSIPPLLDLLGVDYQLINSEVTGLFAHDPEPLEKNLSSLIRSVKENNADLGIAVDPDVDRLVFISEDGSMFGEEYTLVAVADYVLSKRTGNTVSNLSSTRALRDVTEKYGGTYYSAAVGEVNVVEQMKTVSAVIGGEGNGGIILPDLHYGRDALAGIALFLTLLAERNMPASALRSTYPSYFMSKQKIQLNEVNPDQVLNAMAEKYADQDINLLDGVKINFEKSWVHLRKSNTEPIIRIYTEAPSFEEADTLALRFVDELKKG